MNTETLNGSIDKPFSRIRDGLIGGLIAGWVFAVAQMIAAMAAGTATQLPWRMAASVLRGRGAIGADWTFGLWLSGAVMHFGLSSLYGLAWAAIAYKLWPLIRTSLGKHSALAAGYGLLLWLLDFQIIARAAFPWFLSTNVLAQMLLHMLAFGLPLGLYMEARLHTLIHRDPMLWRRQGLVH